MSRRAAGRAGRPSVRCRDAPHPAGVGRPPPPPSSGATVAILTEFMQDCFKDITGWSNSIIKTVVAESEENKEYCQQWLDTWQEKVATAYRPLIEKLFDAEQVLVVLDDIQAQLAKRCKTAGLVVQSAA